jgi:hypothetical protein
MRQNIIDLLSLERGYSHRQAFDEAMALRDRVMCLFLRLRDEVTKTASAELCCHIGGLGRWIQGNIEWGLSSDRYLKPDGSLTTTLPSQSPDIWRETPVDSSNEAPPIPAISWWWEQLGSHF